MLRIALLDGGLLGRKSVGHQSQTTVSVFLLMTFLMRGIHHRFVPALENCASGYNDCRFVDVVDVDFVLVKNREVVGVCELWDAE